MLLTVERYRAITGDTTSTPSEVTARIELAEGELAEVLDRPLAHSARTETLTPTRDGRLWPRATPITVADGWTIDGISLIGPGPLSAPMTWPDQPTSIEVTYSGGWVERTANPAAANAVPACVERDLAVAAYVVGHPTALTSTIPAGATSVRLGDAAVTFGASGASGNVVGDQLRKAWSRRTLGYRYRVVRGVGDTCAAV